MHSAFLLALRRMRAPLIVIVAVYAIAVLGLVLVPGVDASGRPAAPLSFFHAFYFVSFTATTIGFGELPRAFSDGQRLWVTVCIYLAVIAWTYTILSLLALLQDKPLRQAVAMGRFRRAVRRIGEPFYILGGYGETGTLLARSLDHLNIRLVVIDISADRTDELIAHGFDVDVPAITADVRRPDVLVAAGLRHPCCNGVVALTNDDGANLAAAITVRLLNPAIPVLARAESEATVANMASFRTDHIINPFEKFGEYLALALDEPGNYQLLEWLTGIPGTTLRAETRPPRGHWVVCGYGRFGRAVVRHLGRKGQPVTIVDPEPEPGADPPWIAGRGTEAGVLQKAGIGRAVGIVAGTDDDVSNLAIAMTARELHPQLFVVIRQNVVANRMLFDAFKADVTMVPSEIIAHECMAVLTTPLLSRFLDIVKAEKDEWADGVVARLRERVGDQVPVIWRVCLDRASAPGCLAADVPVQLDWLLRSSANRDELLHCIALLLVRGDAAHPLPQPDTALEQGDQLLFAGTREARALQAPVLSNVNVFEYVRTGDETSGGWVWQALQPGAR
jgi:Trk K+ transport system NAD-binding subunit